MGSLERQDRAPNVCTACKNRKRACDKQLPRCGYCIKTFRACVYHEPDSSTISTTSSRSSPQRQGFQATSTTLGALWTLGTADFNTIVHAEVVHALSCTGYTLDQLGQSYLGGVHKWITIIAPEPFQYILAAGITPSLPADLLVLILAVATVTVRPSTDGGEVQLGHPQSLCALTKTIHTWTCTRMPPSVALVQALLLVATYEYACNDVDAAYIDIGACARMSQVIGLHEEPDLRSVQSEPMMTLQARERWNTWWGTVILERLILSETTYSSPPTMPWRPGKYCPLPFNLNGPGFGSGRSETAKDIDTVRLCDIAADDISHFGRQAQAVYLLQQVLEITGSSLESHASIHRRQQIDNELHYLLTCLMPWPDPAGGCGCGAISTSIRALFMLHTHKLGTITASKSHAWLERSAVALESITRMVIDIARSHYNAPTPVNVDKYALTTIYITRDALKCMESAERAYGDDAEVMQNLDAVLAMKRVLHNRWSPRAQ